MDESKIATAASFDPETSVEYYVTTVKNTNKTPIESDVVPLKHESTPFPIVVSVDRAGSVKVRKRKKSKRRKKKSNLAFEDITFQTSDDSLRSHSTGSDGSVKKIPRRSSSISEKDLRRNTERRYIAGIHRSNHSMKENQEKYGLNGALSHVKQKSLNSSHYGMLFDTTNISLKQKNSQTFSRIKAEEDISEINRCESIPSAKLKQLNRQDALATLDAFMMEVEEATTVAKQEQQVEKRKDPLLQRSHSLNEIYSDSDYITFDASDIRTSTASDSVEQAMPPLFSHHKNESVGQHSLLSSVFLSDREVSVDEGRTFSDRSLSKASSGERHSDKRSKSLFDLVIATDAELLSEMMSHHKAAHAEVDGMKRVRSHTSATTEKEFSYGISHLEHVCKLIEQIGDLRNQNQALKKRVRDLEMQVKVLKQTKESDIRAHSNTLDLRNMSSFKRPRPVGRIKGAISRSHKSSIDKSANNNIHGVNGISQPFLLANNDTQATSFGMSLRSSGFSATQLDRPVIHSSIRLKKSGRRFLYSKDDLDLSSKGRWKFWKAPARSVEQPSKQQIISSIKAQHMQTFPLSCKSCLEEGWPSSGRLCPEEDWSQDSRNVASKERFFIGREKLLYYIMYPDGKQFIFDGAISLGSAIHLKSASVTLDSLLNNLDNDFSEKMLQWQSTVKQSRASSMVSETTSELCSGTTQSASSAAFLPSNDDDKTLSSIAVPLSDQKSEVGHKDSLRKKFSKWEKVAARKISWHGDNRRSKSSDRINAAPPYVEKDTVLLRSRSVQAAKPFHNSMPSVEIESNENGSTADKKGIASNSLESAEWSALQEAFPTTQTLNGQSIRSSSHSRLIAPLRKKQNNSKNRRSWSLGRRSTSKYYLPDSVDFGIGSNVELAETISEQMTLQLDQDDVRGIARDAIDEEELNYLKKNTASLREKLKVMESEWSNESTKQKAPSRPTSMHTGIHTDPDVHSSPQSRFADKRQLSSFDLLTSSMMMSPLLEETESLLYQSLPELTVGIEDLRDNTEGSNDDDGNTRRHTISAIDFEGPQRNVNKHMYSSAPSLLDSSPPLTPVLSVITQRVASTDKLTDNLEDSGINIRKWGTTDVLNAKPAYRRTVSSHSESNKSPSKTSTSSVNKHPIQKSDSIKDKLLGQFYRLSPKHHIKSTSSNNIKTLPEMTTATDRLKKKKFRIPSFRSTKPSNIPTNPQYSTDKRTIVDIPASSAPSITRKSSKIAEISERLTVDAESSSRRNSSSPPTVSKGLVNLLSKKFSRQDKKEGDVKSKNTNVTNSTFLSAKHRFENSSNLESQHQMNSAGIAHSNMNNNNCIYVI